METGEVVSRFAVLFSPGVPPRLVGDVRLTEKRRWLSRRTVISYPLEWRIEIPSLSIDLDFAPAADDQEMPVFGIINGIWEGTGAVAGTVAGEPVSGRAWLELYGYGFVVDLAAYQKRWVDRIDATLKDFFPPELGEERLAAFAGAPRWRYDSAAMTEMIAAPAWDLLARGGKHWRPIYGLLLLDALGVDAAPYETAMSAITELVHTGSLIIDDIEDGSQTRRGQETIHVRHGLPTAINAGNMLYFLPLLTISNHPNLSPAQRDEIYRIILEMLVQGHFGQAQDLFWSRPGAVRPEGFWAGEHLGEQILQMHAFKSAAAVRAMSEIACIIAGSDKRQREACARFGESWGVAFQIVDDIHNFSDDPKWGKLRGEDIAAGKASYVISPGRADAAAARARAADSAARRSRGAPVDGRSCGRYPARRTVRRARRLPRRGEGARRCRLAGLCRDPAPQPGQDHAQDLRRQPARPAAGGLSARRAVTLSRIVARIQHRHSVRRSSSAGRRRCACSLAGAAPADAGPGVEAR